MKFFGQYLVSKGIISEDVLADALIEQLIKLPSVVEVVRKKNLLPASVLLNVFARQTEKQLEFKHACNDLGVWNSEIDTLVKKELELLRVPLGQILIKKGATDLQTITKGLDEFLSRAEVASPVTVKENKLETPQPKAVDPLFLDEFVTFLTDERLQDLKSLFSALIEGTAEGARAPLIQNLRKLFNEFRSLRGILKFAQMDKIEVFVAQIEVLIFRAIEQVGQADVHLLPILKDLGHSVVELLGLLKRSLLQEKSENSYLKNPEWVEKTGELFRRCAEVFEQEKIKGET